LRSGPELNVQYRPVRAPAPDDYYYPRIIQVDGEAAWTSPVWIGEQSPPKKQPTAGLRSAGK
jgi:hypothetical protein